MLDRSKAWAVGLLIATFVAGIVVGSSGGALWARHAEGRGTRSRGPDRMLASLTGELHLTPAQHDSVGVILERHWERMNAVWERVQPAFDSIRADMDSQVVQQLTPAQATKYRDHVNRYRQHQDQERHGTERKR